uniref:Uncharacterized protein n=1 Tax=viral metagenome TaxID=1070528 RepID=A0A6C0DCR8_9ZZZZ
MSVLYKKIFNFFYKDQLGADNSSICTTKKVEIYLLILA